MTLYFESNSSSRPLSFPSLSIPTPSPLPPPQTLSVKYDSTKKANKSSNKSLPSWLDTEHIVSSSNMGGNHTTAQVTPLDLVRHLVAQSQELSKNSEDKLKVDVRLGWRANEIAMENGKVKQLKVSSSREGDEVLNVSDVVVAAG